MVDEEHGIRNDGSKSSRSHRASEQSGIQLIAEKKARQLSPTSGSNHMWSWKTRSQRKAQGDTC
jgi:hypothetical protein